MGSLTAYDAIKSHLDGKKTPYQLDLETKDRKPNIVPKVGDRVKIKSREWYEKWKDEEGRVWINNAFVPPMVDFCGKILKIESSIGSFYLLEGNSWSWHPGMFEEVYPAEEQADVNPKTPYQLDLEVMDRKPSIVPKVGDIVRIKSREWYEKWSKENHASTVPVLHKFISGMSRYCGQMMTVSSVSGDKFHLKEDAEDYMYSLEMFEEVYPVQEQLSSKFPRIDLSCHLLLETPSQENKRELITHQVDFGSMIEKTAKRLAAYSLVQGLDAKPKLKQVKTTHLLKLKKL